MRTMLAAALGALLIVPAAAVAQQQDLGTTPGAGTQMERPLGAQDSPGIGTDPSPGIGQQDQLGATPDQPGVGTGIGQQDQLGAAPGQPGVGQAGVAGEEFAVIGRNLKNMQGEELGEIKNVKIDRTGRVSGVVVERDDKHVVVDWQRITIGADDTLQSQMTEDELAGLPEFEDEAN